MQARAGRWRCAGETIGVVPTMGALHEGHLSLVARSLAQCDRTVVTIFVNPLQFGPGEDFGAYPRRPDEDLALLAKAGVDAVYSPSPGVMYPAGASARVRVLQVDEALEAASRPGHFEGVATVVTKLFNATRPDRAYFGQKDAQQAALVTRLARDLDMGVEIVVCPTVREPEGLALSSRNAYLSPEERRAAGVLSQALRAADRAWREGRRDAEGLRGVLRETLGKEPLASIDYAEVVDPLTFRPPGNLAVLAVRIGRTRLIDNHLLGSEPGILD